MKIKFTSGSMFSVSSFVLVLAIAVVGTAQTPEKLTTEKLEDQVSNEKVNTAAVVKMAQPVSESGTEEKVQNATVTADEKLAFPKSVSPVENAAPTLGRVKVLPANQSASSEWQFAFAPYLFASGISGTIGARGRTAEIDKSFGDIFGSLDLGLMGTLEARKGRFVSVTDLQWIKLEEERNTPGALFSSAKLGVNMFIFDPEVGYRVHESEAGSFDILGGVRIMSVETNLDFRAGILPAFDVSQRKSWGTPVIGAHGLINLSPKVFLSVKTDVGGLIGADFTGQFYGGGGFRVSPKLALIGGYRYLKTDYDDNSGFIFDASMSGLLFGAKFTF